jgi:uncharacterized protein YwgA
MTNSLAPFIHFLEKENLVRFDILGESEEHFNNRFKIQKYVFLAKYFGLDLGFNHSIYLYGPYSSDLADAYYDLAEGKSESPHNNMDSSGLPASFNTHAFLEYVGGRDADWLEASSTLLSLNSSFKDRSCLLRRVVNMKPHIKPEKIESALKELEDRNLVTYGSYLT